MSNIMVSIIVPVFNAGVFLKKCINSVLDQTFKNWELVLINDGSKDDSLNICLSFQQLDPRILVINQTNSGPSTARNNGINKARGKYITFLDSDDYLDAYYLEKLIKPFDESQELGMSCGGYFELSKYNKTGLALHDFQNLLEYSFITSNVFFGNIFNGVTGVLWGKMFLSSIIKDNDIQLNPQIKLSEDLLFVFEYASFIERIALVKDNLYYYNRLNADGLSGRLNASNLNDIQLTNDKLLQLGVNSQVPNLKLLLHKRYLRGVIKITKDISTSSMSFKDKVNDLNFIFSEVAEIIAERKGVNKMDRIYLDLFNKKRFTLLIFYNLLVLSLRNLKNKI